MTLPFHVATLVVHTYRPGEGWSVRPDRNVWLIDGLHLTAALGAPPPVETAAEYHRIVSVS